MITSIVVTGTVVVAMSYTNQPAVPIDALQPSTGPVRSTEQQSDQVADALDDVGITNILQAIAQVESRNMDIGRHPDGVSFGRHGVTLIAVRELERVGDVSRNELAMLEKHTEALGEDDRNRRLAYLYLRHMYELHGCQSWIQAAGWYHGGTAEARAAYVDRIRKHL